MKIFYFALLTSLFVFSSCAGNYDMQGSTTIPSYDNRVAYLRVETSEGGVTIIDSADVSHGRFAFYGYVGTPQFAYLYMGGDSIMPLVLETGKLSIEVNDYKRNASGTMLNNRLNKYLNRRAKIESEVEDLEYELTMAWQRRTLSEKSYKNILKRQAALLENIAELEDNFIKENYDNILGVNAFLSLVRNYPIPTATERIRKLLDDAPQPFLENPSVFHYMIQTGLTR